VIKIKKSGVLLITILFLLVSALLVSADTEVTSTDACTILGVDELTCPAFGIEELCLNLIQSDETLYYYDSVTAKCYSTDLVTNTTDTTIDATTVTTTETANIEVHTQLITDLTQRVNSLEVVAGTLQQNVNDMNVKQGEYSSKFSVIDTKLEQISSDLKTIENSLKEDVGWVSTGLAGLQIDLNETETTIDTIEDSLAEEQFFTKLLKIIFFVLFTIAIALGIILFINKRGNKPTISKITPEIADYITRMIKKGKKYSAIKAHLISAGWSEEDIKWAYKETIKHNYNKYKGATSQVVRKTKSSPSLGPDKNKILMIFGILVLLIFGILFLLNGTNVGQAFQITYDSEDLGIVEINCTGEHILNLDGDGCCLDVEPVNEICDYLDRYQEEQSGLAGSAVETGFCVNNMDCNFEEICLDQKCEMIADQYETEDCASSCLLSSVKVFTSDGDRFELVPGSGSYTAAGAIEWKILPTPLFCSGQEELPVLFKIIKKAPSGILGEQVISLSEHETSNVIIHQKMPKVAFTLKVEDVKTSCGI